jgi:hypothetical protein
MHLASKERVGPMIPSEFMTESKERQGEKLDLEETSSRKSIFSADSAHWMADAASDRFRGP